MQKKTQGVSILYTTISTLQEAERLAHLALSEKVAVCVNIIPNGKSIYLWNGQIEQNNECYMIFKSHSTCLSKLEQWIVKNHPYDVPAILKWDVESSAAFAKYIEQIAH